MYLQTRSTISTLICFREIGPRDRSTGWSESFKGSPWGVWLRYCSHRSGRRGPYSWGVPDWLQDKREGSKTGEPDWDDCVPTCQLLSPMIRDHGFRKLGKATQKETGKKCASFLCFDFAAWSRKFEVFRSRLPIKSEPQAGKCTVIGVRKSMAGSAHR